MRRISLAGLVATAFIAAAAMVPGQARAVPLATAPGMLATVDIANGVEQVRYRCRRVRRCNRWGCRWHRSCYRYRQPYYRAPSFGFYGPSFGLSFGAPRRHCYWRGGRRHCYWR